jgi:hypothetical protein
MTGEFRIKIENSGTLYPEIGLRPEKSPKRTEK